MADKAPISPPSPAILWDERKHFYLARVDVLERAASSFLQGSLTAELREHAKTAAHELAGGLGEFGFVKGITLADEIEVFFAKETMLPNQGSVLLHKIMELHTELKATPPCDDPSTGMTARALSLEPPATVVEQISTPPGVPVPSMAVISPSASPAAATAQAQPATHSRKSANDIPSASAPLRNVTSISQAGTPVTAPTDPAIVGIPQGTGPAPAATSTSDLVATGASTLAVSHSTLPNDAAAQSIPAVPPAASLINAAISAAPSVAASPALPGNSHGAEAAATGAGSGLAPAEVPKPIMERRAPERRAGDRGRAVYLDDDIEMRSSAEGWLRDLGFEVFTAEDGVTGLDLIRAQQPRLVLLGLTIPRMHGFAVCEAIRADPILKDTVIVAISAKAYQVDIKKAQDVGASAFLHKPFDAQELRATIGEALKTTTIRVKFWGTRGSIATPGKNTVRYGGNTSCVEVRYGDTVVLFDCGTGARELGMALATEFKNTPLHAHIMVSHSHWDHIQGFPFFTPAYTPGNRVTLYSLRGADKSLEKVFTGQMDSSYFPVAVSDMMSHLEFVELDGPVTLGGATISHIFLNHPGLAVGFRIDVHGKSVVYVTDHEPFWRMSGENDYNLKLDKAITDFAHDADLYIREAQYTDEEYPLKKGWGHSTWSDALHSAQEAGAQSLALFHHDPLHDDQTMDRIFEDCRAEMHRLGMTFHLIIASDYQEVFI